MGLHHIGQHVDIFDWRIAGFTSVSPDNPGAGNLLNWENPYLGRIQLIAAAFIFATSATIQNRLVIIRAVDGTGEYGYSPAPGIQEASETILYNFAPCALGVDISADDNFMSASLSPMIFLDRGQHLQIDATTLQTGDAFTNIDLRFLRTQPF